MLFLDFLSGCIWLRPANALYSFMRTAVVGHLHAWIVKWMSVIDCHESNVVISNYVAYNLLKLLLALAKSFILEASITVRSNRSDFMFLSSYHWRKPLGWAWHSCCTIGICVICCLFLYVFSLKKQNIVSDLGGVLSTCRKNVLGFASHGMHAMKGEQGRERNKRIEKEGRIGHVFRFLKLWIPLGLRPCLNVSQSQINKNIFDQGLIWNICFMLAKIIDCLIFQK